MAEVVFSQDVQHYGSSNSNSRGRDHSISQPAVLSYNQEINSLAKQKQVAQACQLFDSMIKSRVSPDVVTYNTMINMFVKESDLPKALQFFMKMKSVGIPPNVVTYTSIIDGCGKGDSLPQALQLYREALESNIETNLHFFNAILNAALLAGEVDITERIMQEMRSKQLSPNQVTFHTLLTGYQRVGRFDKFYQTIQQMEVMKADFTSVAFSAIVQSAQWIKTEQDLAAFLSVLRISKAIASNVSLCQSVVLLIDARRLELAFQLARFLLESHVTLDPSVYSSLLRLAGTFSNFKIIKWISENVLPSDPSIQIDVYAANVNAYTRFGNFPTAMALFQRIRDSHLDIPMEAGLSMIRCFLTANQAKEALSVSLLLIKQKSINENYSDRIVQPFYDKGLHQEVHEIFQNLPKTVELGPRGADCIIGSYIALGIDTEDISQLHPTPIGIVQLANHATKDVLRKIPWVSMIENCHAPPPSTMLFEMMNAFMAKGLNEAAWIAFKHFAQQGLIPSENSLELALQTQMETKCHENLQFIIDVARDASIKPSSELWSEVMKSAISDGNIAEAMSIHNEMESAHVELRSDANALYTAQIDSVMKAMPSLRGALVDKKVIRGRSRSNTCPRMHNPDIWGGMEEISNRSALLALGTDDI